MLATLPRSVACAFAILVTTATAAAAAEPQYDLLIRGGRAIDPRHGVDDLLDVAIAGGAIARVAAAIPEAEARLVIDATGLIVTPGLVDLHAHVALGSDNVPPDAFAPRSCVTTLVDAGGEGWRGFPQFEAEVIDVSTTRVLAFLNIVGAGMKGFQVEQNHADMDPRAAARAVEAHREVVVGIKTAHYEGPDWTPVDRAVEAGRLAGVPVMVDFGRFVPERPFPELVLEHLRPGDLYTHTYNDGVPMFDEEGKLLPYLLEARRRGVLFDVGHGGGSFAFRKAIPALRQGFAPDAISTDLHTGSMNAGMKDLPNVLSKFLNMGLALPEVVLRATWNPARIVGREDLGHLGPGAMADVAVLALRRGSFGFVDSEGARLEGDRKLECALTLRAGKVAWDLDGLAAPRWEAMAQVGEGIALARAGRVEEALAAFARGPEIDPKLTVAGWWWRRLCWEGALAGHAAEAMPACEQAVGSAPGQDWLRDGRGLACALTGDRAGAIEDFTAFAGATSDLAARDRARRWSEQLAAGEDPFTGELLDALRSP